MKKILALGFVLALFTAAASAQQTKSNFREDRQYHQRFDQGQLTKGERYQLRKNDHQFNHTKNRFKRDGRISPMERKKLSKMKRHDRRETYRYRHNSRRS